MLTCPMSSTWIARTTGIHDHQTGLRKTLKERYHHQISVMVLLKCCFQVINDTYCFPNHRPHLWQSGGPRRLGALAVFLTPPQTSTRDHPSKAALVSVGFNSCFAVLWDHSNGNGKEDVRQLGGMIQPGLQTSVPAKDSEGMSDIF